MRDHDPSVAILAKSRRVDPGRLVCAAPQPARDASMYPVQFRLEDGSFAIHLAEIRDWLQKHRIDPGLLHYRMRKDHVRLRVEFTKPSHAAAFRAAFKDQIAEAA